MFDVWILYSFIALITTVLSTILIRKLHLLSVPFKLQTSVQFIFPFLGFLIWILLEPKLLEIKFSHLLLVFVYAVFFVQLGTILSVKSITLAKNPAYAMAITRVNILIATFASVFLFGSYLSLMTLLSTLIIFIFSFFILDYAHSENKKSNLWFWYALGGGILTSGYALGSKYFILESVPFLTRMFYAFLAMSFVAGFDLYINRTKIKVTKKRIIFLLSLGLLTFLFNIFAQFAFESAPNPGFVNSFIAISLIPILFLSTYYFKDELSLRKLFGVFGVFLGLILLYIFG